MLIIHVYYDGNINNTVIKIYVVWTPADKDTSHLSKYKLSNYQAINNDIYGFEYEFNEKV